MNDFTPLHDAIQWHEGMLLSAQHLQQNDIHWQQHLAHRLGSLNPHYWGLRQLLIDECVIDGEIKIETLECVLADGALVQYRRDTGLAPLKVNLADVCRKPGDRASVWLIVHERAADAASGVNKKRRFDCLGPRPTIDENTGEGSEPVHRIRLRLRLEAITAGAAPPLTCLREPLFQVEANAENRLRVTPYHPPMLRLDACLLAGRDSLQTRCQVMVRTLWNRANGLAGRRGGDRPEDGPTAWGGSDSQLAVVRGLASVLPLLEILAADPATHPARMYEAFALAVGHVAGFGGNPIPLRMEPYRHADCMPQFEAAFDYIHKQLTLVPQNHDFLPFGTVRGQQGYHCFARRMTADVGDEVLVEIHHRADFAAELTSWVHRVRIVSYPQLQDAEEQRLLGARRRLLLPDELRKEGLAANAVVLRIANEAGGKRFILPSQALMLLTPDDMPYPQAITLVARHRKAAAPAHASAHEPAHQAMPAPAPVLPPSAEEPHDEQ
jgi:type VI secretion system protein ImpJ